MTQEISHTNYYYDNANNTFSVILAVDFNEAAQNPAAHEWAKASIYFKEKGSPWLGCFFTEGGKYCLTDGKARNGRFSFLEAKPSADDPQTLIAKTAGIKLSLSFSEDGKSMAYHGSFMHGQYTYDEDMTLSKRENWPVTP